MEVATYATAMKTDDPTLREAGCLISVAIGRDPKPWIGLAMNPAEAKALRTALSVALKGIK